MPDANSIERLRTKAIQVLQAKGIEDAVRSVDVLLAHVLEKNTSFLFAHPEHRLTQAQYERWNKLIEQRSAHVPVAYLTGQKEFYGRTFQVTPDVLIPRPETELMVDLVKQASWEGAKVLDMGTGSGILAITLCLELTPSSVTAVDASRKALEVAKQNAKQLGADVTFVHSDLWDAVADHGYDIVVANLPYVDALAMRDLPANVLHEPAMALDGGADGLDLYKHMLSQAAEYVSPHAMVWMEIDPSQTPLLEAFLEQNGFHAPKVYKDLQGLDRVMQAKRKT